jgi:hypothetical protein
VDPRIVRDENKVRMNRTYRPTKYKGKRWIKRRPIERFRRRVPWEIWMLRLERVDKHAPVKVEVVSEEWFMQHHILDSQAK